MSHPQNTPVFDSVTVPETYMTIWPPSPSEPSVPEGWAPLAFTPRYFTTPSTETFPSTKTVPRTSRNRVLGFHVRLPTTLPFTVVWHVYAVDAVNTKVVPRL